MEKKKPTHLQYCDLCHAPVVFAVGTMDEYTTTTIEGNKIHIAFHCPDCIAKHNIVTDAQHDPFEGLPFDDEVPA